jgi:hypothetical protein
MNSNWKTVQPKKGNQETEKHVRRELTNAMYPNGFRSFANLEEIFSVVLVAKLRQRYPNVMTEVFKETDNGPNAFTFVKLVLSGPQSAVKAAFDDAEPFLATDKQNPDRYFQRTWAPPTTSDLAKLVNRSHQCARNIGIQANYSPSKSHFFFTTLILNHEVEANRHNGSHGREGLQMLQDAQQFMLGEQQHQTFRMPFGGNNTNHHQNAAHAPHTQLSPNRHPRDGGNARTSSLSAQVAREIERISGMLPSDGKRALRALFDEIQPQRPDDVLLWHSICLDFEKSYIMHDYASNETPNVRVVLSHDFARMVELKLDEENHYPFTQRHPKIGIDDLVIVRSESGGDPIEMQVYMVKDLSLVAHIKEEDNEAVAALVNKKVSITFDSKSLIGYKSSLQKALTNEDAFNQLRGKGVYHGNQDRSTAEDIERMIPRASAYRKADGDDDDGDEILLAAFEPGSRGRGGAPAAGAQGPRAERGGYRSERGGVQSRGGGGRGAAAFSHTNATAAETDTASLLDGLQADQRVACYAITHATSPRIFLDGMAGTGKTETIARAVSILLRSNTTSRVVIVTPTVAAGDVIARRLIQVMLTTGELVDSLRKDILRLYGPHVHPLNVDPVLYEFSNRPVDQSGKPLVFGALRYESRFERASDYFEDHTDWMPRVVIFTPTGIRRLPQQLLSSTTHVIIDEAGATTLEEGIAVFGSFPYDKKRCFVLSGDSRQLRPRVSCPFLKQALQVTPLSGFDTALKISLTGSHRASSALVELQSLLFYDGKLHSANRTPAADADAFPRWSGHDGNPGVVRIFNVEGEETRTGKVRARAAGYAPSTADLINKREVDIVEDVVRSLKAECGVKAADIGVVCEYPEQQRAIRNRLAMVGMKLVKVLGIDDYQGDEKDVIVITMTRSKYDSKDPDAIDASKLCTATTRARRLAVFIGNVQVYLNRDLDKHHGRNSRGKWTDLVTHCIDNKCITGYDYATKSYVDAPRLNVGDAGRSEGIRSCRNAPHGAAQDAAHRADTGQS